MTTQTTAAEHTHARGVLEECAQDRIVLGLPGTDYRLHLAVYQPPHTPVGKRITGTIRAQARRVDIVHTGGRFIEPVYGRPRRVQGRVTAVDPSSNSIVVDAGAPIVCRLTDPRQRADQFKPGDFVSFDVLPGATFTPAGA